MFKTDFAASSPLTRRVFLAAGSAAAVGAVMATSRRRASERIALAAERAAAAPVTIVDFDAAGRRLGTERVPVLIQSDEEWRKQLGSGTYSILRQADTEFAYSGQYWENHAAGLYRCAGCKTAVFSSATKFDSGTGWPSFWEPVANENVHETSDSSFGMTRTAVSCRRCEGHLGHVFTDGPPPTGLRYCINSAALVFRGMPTGKKV